MRTSVRSSAPGAELERLRERRDQRQAEPEAGAVRPRQHPAALVVDDDRQAVVAHPRADPERALAVGIGVDDDVGARLGHGELDVRQRLVGHVERVAESRRAHAERPRRSQGGRAG